MKKNNKKGFTIVELVIVIAVIAILAAVLIPTFSGVVEKANKSAATQTARNFYTAIETASAATETYTTGSYKYTCGMAKTGLVITRKDTTSGAGASPAAILKVALGNDGKQFDGATLYIKTSEAYKFAHDDTTWTISTIYFQPKNSNYAVEINFTEGKIGDAVEASTLTIDSSVGASSANYQKEAFNAN